MYISIDIGGTNTRVASSDNLFDVISFENFPSSTDINITKENLQKAIKKVSNGHKVNAVISGIAGFIDKKNGIVLNSPNYKVLNGLSIRELLSIEDTEVPLFTMNDTELSGLAEACLGAGKSYEVVAYLGMGTGIGGTVITNKKLSNRKYEIGHTIVNFDDQVSDGLGIHGAFESYASGTAFYRNYTIKPHECTDSRIWHDFGKKVGVGIQNIIFSWDPDCIVIGGGMSKYLDRFLAGINETLLKSSFVNIPPIFQSQFENGSGIVGGFVYLSQKGFK